HDSKTCHERDCQQCTPIHRYDLVYLADIGQASSHNKKESKENKKFQFKCLTQEELNNILCPYFNKLIPASHIFQQYFPEDKKGEKEMIYEEKKEDDFFGYTEIKQTSDHIKEIIVQQNKFFEVGYNHFNTEDDYYNSSNKCQYCYLWIPKC